MGEYCDNQVRGDDGLDQDGGTGGGGEGLRVRKHFEVQIPSEFEERKIGAKRDPLMPLLLSCEIG